MSLVYRMKNVNILVLSGFGIWAGGLSFVHAQTWRWIAFGDTRNNRPEHRQVLESMVANTPDYTFIINVGDVVDHGDREEEWIDWQQTTVNALGSLGQDQQPPKYMATPGNHDATETSAGLANWNKYLPGQVSQFGNEGKFFVFDYMNARFVILDSDKSPMSGTQYDMMMEAIQNNPQTWLFAFWHHPIFDFGEKSYEDDIHDLWGVPLYESGCDLVFTGHAHYYARTEKLALNGEMHPPVDRERGTAQIVTGNGGAPIDIPAPDHDGNGYMALGYGTDSSHYGYTELSVTPDSLVLTHYLRDGSVLDEAVYTPNPKSGTPVQENGDTSRSDGFRLYQNYPNPFNPNTYFTYSIVQSARVELSIFDVEGRCVDTIVNAHQSRGTYEVEWSIRRDGGGRLPSGLYAFRLKAGDRTQIRKMMILQ